MLTGQKRPNGDIDGDGLATDANPSSNRRANKTARNAQTADAATAAKAQQRAPSTRPNVNKENDAPATAAARRSGRDNKGKGGHAAQLEKVAQNIRPDLDKDSGSRKQNAVRRGAEFFPKNVPENVMAPPAPQRQQRRSAAATFKAALKRPRQPDPPLELTPPVPTLQINQPGSQYGLHMPASNVHTSSGSQAAQNSAPSAPRSGPLHANALFRSDDSHGRAREQQMDQDNGADDIYGDDDDRPASREGSEEGDEGNRPNTFFEQDFDMDDHLNQEDDSGFNPAKYYYEEGIGLVAIEQPNAEHARDPNDAGALLTNIDETSPSEDEATWSAALRGPASANAELAAEDSDFEDDGQDVLQEHRSRNRANRAPPPQRLRECAEVQSANRQSNQDGSTQSAKKKASLDENSDTDGSKDTDMEDSDGSTAAAEKRSKRRRRTIPEVPNPTTLRSYPGDWKAILNVAKRHWQRYIVVDRIDPFPDRDDHIDEARDVLDKVISERRAKGEALSYRHRSRDQDVVVFKEGATFRGRLKTLAISVVKMHFRDVLDIDTCEIPGQRDVERLKKQNVEAILEGSVFHQHGLDRNGKTNNLAHPSIPALILKFFYSGKDSLAALFPDDFSQKVPEHVIALVLTVIKNVLDEWANGGVMRTPIPFTGREYLPVFDAMKEAIDVVKTSPYHHEKYEMSRVRWAQMGMRNLRKEKDAIAKDYAVKLTLD